MRSNRSRNGWKEPWKQVDKVVILIESNIGEICNRRAASWCISSQSAEWKLYLKHQSERKVVKSYRNRLMHWWIRELIDVITAEICTSAPPCSLICNRAQSAGPSSLFVHSFCSLKDLVRAGSDQFPPSQVIQYVPMRSWEDVISCWQLLLGFKADLEDAGACSLCSSVCRLRLEDDGGLSAASLPPPPPRVQIRWISAVSQRDHLPSTEVCSRFDPRGSGAQRPAPLSHTGEDTSTQTQAGFLLRKGRGQGGEGRGAGLVLFISTSLFQKKKEKNILLILLHTMVYCTHPKIIKKKTHPVFTR